MELKTKYLYVTDDLEELTARPRRGYTYMLLVELAQPDEADEDRIVSVSVDLLRVRLGRSAYRGVQSQGAQEELCGYLTDVLEEIATNGIEAYCQKQ